MDDEKTGLVIAGGGAVALLVGMVVGSRLLRLLGLLGALAGGSLYARAKYSERSEKIDEAASNIQSELDDLDPVAQAQVLAKLAHHPDS
jgi:hypothetical protein